MLPQVLISKLDAAHSRPFRDAAAMYASPEELIGEFGQCLKCVRGC